MYGGETAGGGEGRGEVGGRSVGWPLLRAMQAYSYFSPVWTSCLKPPNKKCRSLVCEILSSSRRARFEVCSSRDETEAGEWQCSHLLSVFPSNSSICSFQLVFCCCCFVSIGWWRDPLKIRYKAAGEKGLSDVGSPSTTKRERVSE